MNSVNSLSTGYSLLQLNLCMANTLQIEKCRLSEEEIFVSREAENLTVLVDMKGKVSSS